MFDRRNILQLGGASLAIAGLPRVAFAAAAATDRRFLFVIQRGAADGLATLSPTGDPAFAGLRGDLADVAGGARIDPMFTLHPALAETAKLYAAKQASFVHAVASPYRDRSHFDGQNVLESGGGAPYRVKDGWMNRLLGQLPGGKAVALAPTVPLALRGDRPVSSYAPSNLPDAEDDLLIRIGDLYAQDPQLGPLWNQAQATRMKAGAIGDAKGGAAVGALAAKLMSGNDGARIAVVETNGWDTHNGQKGRLNAQLRGLDALIAAYRAGMGVEWNKTLVLVATEFGRTAKANGTGGTDHGTGALAMLAGGAVAGGRIVADWPGLAPGALYEGRDLKPTMDLDALIATALAQHFRIEGRAMASTLFPDTRPTALAQRFVL
jgi:uncharacterized protein (DUF1501 family)